MLKEGGRGGSGGRRRGRSALLVAEVALSMVLLVGAGLMMHGFLGEQSKLPGFPVEHLLTADILLGGTKYFDKTPGGHEPGDAASPIFSDRLSLERVRAYPGSDARRHRQPSAPAGLDPSLHDRGQARPPSPERSRRPTSTGSTRQLLDTLGIRLLRGARDRGARRRAPSPWVAVVNKTFADRHFPGEDPLGQTIRLSIGAPGGSGHRAGARRGRSSGWRRPTCGIRAFSPRPPPRSTTSPVARQHLSQYGRENEWIRHAQGPRRSGPRWSR